MASFRSKQFFRKWVYVYYTNQYKFYRFQNNKILEMSAVGVQKELLSAQNFFWK